MWGRTSLAVLALAAGSIASATGFNFTFDTDNQGWTRGNFGNGFAGINKNIGPATWDAATQSILGSDFTGYAYHFSPDLGGSHGALFGTDLTLDYRSVGSGSEDPFVVLMSSTDFIVLEKTILASANLNPYSIKLDSTSGFFYNSSQYYNGGAAVTATDAQIQAVLNDLRYIGVSTDIAGGGDTTYLDNVNAVPEPTTIALLGLGGAALLRKRFKKQA